MCEKFFGSKNDSFKPIEGKGLSSGNTWAATESGNTGKKPGGSISVSVFHGGFIFLLWLTGSLLLGIPSSPLAWLTLCLRDLLQILKELASSIWLIISPLDRQRCGSLAGLRNESGAHMPCIESLRVAFLTTSIIMGCWVWQAPRLTCFRVLQVWLNSPPSSWGNKGTIS